MLTASTTNRTLRRLRIMGTLSALALSTAGCLMPPGSPGPTGGNVGYPAPASFAIVSDRGLCLDVHGPDLNRNGGRVQVWDCHGGVNQTFYFDGGAVVSEAGLCLDVHGPDLRKNGGRVQFWECHGGINQQWSYNERSGALQSAGGLCLDADGHNAHRNGGRVQVWQCLRNTNQRWYPQ